MPPCPFLEGKVVTWTAKQQPIGDYSGLSSTRRRIHHRLSHNLAPPGGRLPVPSSGANITMMSLASGKQTPRFCQCQRQYTVRLHAAGRMRRSADGKQNGERASVYEVAAFPSPTESASPSPPSIAAELNSMLCRLCASRPTSPSGRGRHRRPGRGAHG